MTSSPTVASRAVVTTDSPERYAKQLASHLGRKLEVVEEEGATRIVFPSGECRLTCSPGRLELRASAPEQGSLEQVEDVVGRHLERFGARAELVVAWEPVATPPVG
jgi:uncharacterized protein